MDEGEIAFEDVEVGAADSAGEDAEEEVIGGEDWAGDLFELERPVGGVEDGCFHEDSSGVRPRIFAEVRGLRRNADWQDDTELETTEDGMVAGRLVDFFWRNARGRAVG